jgi:uncharacterized membrane protein YedE/YeeE|tara:strand:- start:5439 stop:5660 length:222 start_codon:yes stop_codon:yes gene_type:complete
MESLVELGALVFGLTEVLKGFCPEKHRKVVAPLLAVVLGGLANVYLLGYSPEALVLGLTYGLAAAGLYNVAKK